MIFFSFFLSFIIENVCSGILLNDVISSYGIRLCVKPVLNWNEGIDRPPCFAAPFGFLSLSLSHNSFYFLLYSLATIFNQQLST